MGAGQSQRSPLDDRSRLPLLYFLSPLTLCALCDIGLAPAWVNERKCRWAHAQARWHVQVMQQQAVLCCVSIIQSSLTRCVYGPDIYLPLMVSRCPRLLEEAPLIHCEPRAHVQELTKSLWLFCSISVSSSGCVWQGVYRSLCIPFSQPNPPCSCLKSMEQK